MSASAFELMNRNALGGNNSAGGQGYTGAGGAVGAIFGINLSDAQGLPAPNGLMEKMVPGILVGIGGDEKRQGWAEKFMRKLQQDFAELKQNTPPIGGNPIGAGQGMASSSVGSSSVNFQALNIPQASSNIITGPQIAAAPTSGLEGLSTGGRGTSTVGRA